MTKYNFKRKTMTEIMAVHNHDIERVIKELKSNDKVKKVKVESRVAFDDHKNPIFGYKVVVKYTT